MKRKSKSDWQAEQSNYSEQTGAEVQESDETKEDAENASRDFGDQKLPSLSDTAEDLNRLGENLRAEIRQQHGEQADKVEQSIETQRREISEPARSDENEERAAADEFDVQSSKNRRFGRILAEAAEERRDAENFLRDIAETDEDNQHQSKDTLENHRKAVDDAVNSIEDFDF